MDSPFPVEWSTVVQHQRYVLEPPSAACSLLIFLRCRINSPNSLVRACCQSSHSSDRRNSLSAERADNVFEVEIERERETIARVKSVSYSSMIQTYIHREQSPLRDATV
jgi:hypothetical protein